MTVKQLIEELQKIDKNLELIAYSTNPETGGCPEGIGFIGCIELTRDYSLNGTSRNLEAFPSKPVKFLKLYTNPYKAWTVRRMIKELAKMEDTLQVVCEPMGSYFIEIDDIEKVYCGRKNIECCDMMDGTVFNTDVLEIRTNGIEKILLYNRKLSVNY